MKKTKKIILLFTVLTLLLSLCIPAFASENAVNTLNDPDGRVIGVSSRGMCRDYPENSLEGILAAGKTGIDFVLTDVSQTSDGVFVLFADETTERMLDGTPENVADMTFAELGSRTLKEYSGGAGAKTSGSKVPSLEQALGAARENGFSLMLKTPVGILAGVCGFLAEKEMTDSVVLLVDAKTKDIEAALTGCGKVPPVIGVKRGNVIFAILSYISGAEELGFSGVQLRTTNRYGINFNQTVLRRFKGTMRAAADTSDPKYTGAREDSEKWWDDLISRGYSVIITDEAELFADYLKRNDAARERLAGLYKRYTEEWTLPAFASELFNDYKKAYTDAKTEAERLLSDDSVSLRELNDCAAAIQKAVDEINANYGELEAGTAGMTVSPVRIGLCVGAAVVVIAVQIFFFRKREKRVK